MGKLRIISALLLLSIGAFFLVRSYEANRVVADTVSSEPVKFQGFSNTTIDNGDVRIPVRIIIPDLSIDVPIKKAPIIKGYWELFTDAASWGEGSGLPGDVGNTVIFAHVREGLFLPLEKVTLGARVYVLTGGGWYGYYVTDIKVVNPNQVEVVAPTPDETLTLYTCSGPTDSKRLVVVGKRIT
jgi:sortase A